MIINLKKLGAIGMLLGVPFLAHAELGFKSADFDFEGKDLLDKVAVNLAAGSGNVLYCRADINVAGEADRVNCFAKGATNETVVETEAALKDLAFSSAEVDGEAIPVRMSFRVAYSQVGDTTHVTLIPNIGTMQAQYGRNYVAPQERLDLSDWYERYADKSWANGDDFLGHGDMSRISATVKADGKPSMVKTVDTTRAYERDAKLVKNSFRHARFLPGTVNGKVVPMEYVVAVHYEGSNEAYADAR